MYLTIKKATFPFDLVTVAFDSHPKFNNCRIYSMIDKFCRKFSLYGAKISLIGYPYKESGE